MIEVDLDGVFFHGTRAPDIRQLRSSRSGEFGPGVYLTDREATAWFYADHVAGGTGEPRVLQARVSIENPFVVKKVDWLQMTERSTPKTVQNRLKRKGYDSIVGIALNDYEYQLVVFDPNDVELLRDNPLQVDEIDDPFEPAFHAAASKDKRKVLAYHGTTTLAFWPIALKGFAFDPEGKAWEGTSPGVYFTFDQDNAGLYASHAVDAFGGDLIFFVVELPISEIKRDMDDAETHDKGRNLQGMIEAYEVPPKFITGVIYPASSTGPETPIRKFIKQVNRGMYDVDGLEPRPDAKLPRYSQAKPQDIEHAATGYLADLLGYSSLDSWLVGVEWLEFKRRVMTALIAIPWQSWSNWTAKRWLRFVEDTLGEEIPGDDYVWEEIERNRAFQLPFYRVRHKYEESRELFEEYRLGKRRR
jgi:hypothetical protein